MQAEVADDARLWSMFMAADANGYRFEYVGGVGSWELQPAFRHQSESFRIQSSIRPARNARGGCRCIHAADVYIRFPDGSFKRPDIAVFCREPDEQETAVTLLPEAVVEILSPGFEAKDTEVGAPFYLAQGVKDIILYDPRTKAVTHLRRDGERALQSPATIEMECGCVCEV